MKSVIITVGDELLIGQVVNTNAAFIAEKLTPAGADIIRIVTVPDDEPDIYNSLNECFKLADLIILTGGLGPTHDDVTRKAVCKYFNTEPVPSEEARQYVLRFLQQRNYPWTESADDQIMIPRGAKIIPNKHGTAPGELFETDGKCLIVLPGVPYEMESMIEDFVLPYVKTKAHGRVILQRTLRTTGIAEAMLARRLGDILELLGGEKLAFLPSPTGVRLRITVSGNERTVCEEKLQRIEERIRSRAENFIYGTEKEELEEVLGRLLRERNLKIAVAESCTGGLIANKLTNVPGSSLYFESAVVAYSNRSKTEILKVPEELIRSRGAVSSEVASRMALSVREISAADIGISTTGIAGPSGGSPPEKPVGLVWIGYSDVKGTSAVKFQFGDGRTRIKERASQAAMNIVRKKILGIE